MGSCQLGIGVDRLNTALANWCNTINIVRVLKRLLVLRISISQCLLLRIWIEYSPNKV